MNELGQMTDSERTANEAAEFLPASLFGDADANVHPCIQVGGAQVYAYVQDGTLVVSVDLDTADSGVFSIYEPYVCVPVRVNVGPETVFEARP